MHLPILGDFPLPPEYEPNVYTVYQRTQFDKITLAWLSCWPINCTGLWTRKQLSSKIVFYEAHRLFEGLPQTLHWHILISNNSWVNITSVMSLQAYDI